MLKFATFNSDIELPFYASLASHKINHDKLDDSARRLLGVYEIRPTESPETSCRLQLHGNALTADGLTAGYYRAEGMIKNVNTIEEYRGLDKGSMLNKAAHTIWDAINDETIYSCPSLLSYFTVLCFADLKKYKFTYLFAFPALHSDPGWRFTPTRVSTSSNVESGHDSSQKPSRLSSQETTLLVDAVQTWRYAVEERQYGFFLAKKKRYNPFLHPEASGNPADDEDGRPKTPATPGNEPGYQWGIASLASYETGFFEGTDGEDCFVCFADPSTYEKYPGWMLRNLLVLVSRKWKLDKVQILCYRDIPARRHEAHSIILQLEQQHDSKFPGTVKASEPPTVVEMPKITGWERNSAGKVMSKIANLGDYMDPQRLADQAVDLNLKLIKWRIAPSLDLDIIKSTRCLLLGAGTLGSYVARNLMGWGVRKITFVDNGVVSFSNPVRQPLFNFEDCLAGGAQKAHRAAAALKQIYPGVDSAGHVLSVPMAGHPIMDEDTVKSEFDALQALIQEHDAIFLLMDTRESRWLPTVMGKAARKTVLNAALGFDTYVVMRHGVRDEEALGQELGCYFCNDVVAPADSVSDRTLDQQCTVTRPGVAAIASALLVETLISVLQHPWGARAPAPTFATDEPGDHPLGIVPHQIRGFLSNFENKIVKGHSYDCCSACSVKVISAYRAEGWAFVKRALNERGYVEELSGLAEVQRLAEKAIAEIELSDIDSTGEDEDGELI